MPSIQEQPIQAALDEQSASKAEKVIISVRHLRKVYRIGDDRVVALADINLEILTGQIVCIVGTSGSGKSTLLNQLAGLEKPTKGAVFIGKTNVSKLSENKLALFRQRYLGFVFQSYNLLATMTAMENVELPLTFKGVGRSKRRKAALAMLAAVGLKKRARHRPSQMSGGQQQRVGIARAFVTQPKVIFADEPTGNLDSKTTVDVMRMMVRFARKYRETLILVTHDPELAEYADRVITLIDGAVISDEHRTPIYNGQDEPSPAIGQSPTEHADVPGLLEQMLADTAPLPDAQLLPPAEELGEVPDELPDDIELPGESDLGTRSDSGNEQSTKEKPKDESI